MQGFEAKKRMIRVCIFFPYPSILRILPFHAFAPPGESNPGAMVKQLRVIIITLRSLHQLIDKMSHVNQMYEKGNVSIRKEKKNTVNVPFAKSP